MKTSLPKHLAIICAFACLALHLHAGEVKAGDHLPLEIKHDGKLGILIVLGGTMNDWFVQSCARQAQEIAKKYQGKVEVWVGTPHNTGALAEFFPDDKKPTFTFHSAELTAEIDHELGYTGTPWMAIVDEKNTIIKIQDGWHGFKTSSLESTPWLVQVASAVIDPILLKADD